MAEVPGFLVALGDDLYGIDTVGPAEARFVGSGIVTIAPGASSGLSIQVDSDTGIATLVEPPALYARYLLSGPFVPQGSHPLNQIHRDTRWMVSRTDTEEVVLDTWWDQVHLLSYETEAIFEPGITYRLDVFHGDWMGLESLAGWATFLDGVIVGGEEIPAEMCSLLLEVFAADRETVAWSVGTSRYHPRPYLDTPEHYGEQEVDVVAGAASIAQIEVVVLDPSRVAGDQTTGWMTERISEGIRGRRCRLRRWVGGEVGFMVIADGPAGVPRLDASYSAYRWPIRDTRDTERKVRAFVGNGTSAILPMGVVGGFGPVPAVVPLEGTAGVDTTPDVYAMTTVNLQLATAPGGTGSRWNISQAVYEKLLATSLEALGPTTESDPGVEWTTPVRARFQDIKLMWRLAGEDDDDWRELSTTLAFDTHLQHDSPDLPHASTVAMVNVTPDGEGWTVTGVFFTDARDVPLHPDDAEDIELMIVFTGRPTKVFPFHIQGITDGELLVNGYSGVYSPRDPVTGDLVPTAIRYDEAAVLQMDTPVALRLEDWVDDLRAWAEKIIYAPRGWVPALDNAALVSPVSQVPPADMSEAVHITQGIVEPTPDWDAGERIVNAVRYTYPRYYVDPASEAVDGLSKRDVVVEYRNDDSIREHGEELVEFDGAASAAIGDSSGGAVGDELGAVLAAARWMYIGERYVHGAQAISLPAMRSHTSGVRAGSFVVVDELSWLPNLATGLRGGSVWNGQVLSVRDDNCAWRTLLIEEIPAVPV